jgi:hypothetical protein
MAGKEIFMRHPDFFKLARATVVAALISAVAAPTLYAADALIGPDAWRAMTAGKTLHYYRDGELHGREYYYPDGEKVEFCSADGLQAVGRWAFADDTYCFAYFGDLHCFQHVLREGEIYVVDVNDAEDEQMVDHITDGGPPPCSEALKS